MMIEAAVVVVTRLEWDLEGNELILLMLLPVNYSGIQMLSLYSKEIINN